MWTIIWLSYALVGLLTFRIRFMSMMKATDRYYAKKHQDDIEKHKDRSYCGTKECTGRDHIPNREEADGGDWGGAVLWGLINGTFWLPALLAKVFWKGMFPKGVLAETRKERKQRLKKEAETEAEALLQKAKEMGLM